jgi:TolA-binding protein
MKAQERHHLKQNEFAATTARVVETIKANRDRTVIGVIVVAVIVAVGGAYLYWKKHTNDQAGMRFGIAMSILRAQIAPAPTLPGATQAPGTYPTEQAKHEAALKAFEEVARDYGSTPSGIAARYQGGAELIALGRYADAEKAFQDAIDHGGSTIYAATAKLGLAEALAEQKKYDDAIKRLTDLAADRDGALPLDGVLMQLARVSARAGKPQEARAAYKRVVDEFPESIYANEARTQLTLLG